MSIQPSWYSLPNISKETAESYLKSVGDSMENIVPAISRMEYLKLLKEANDEGRVARELGSTIETKEQWEAQQFWTAYPKDLQHEFYIAYRRGYINQGKLKGE